MNIKFYILFALAIVVAPRAYNQILVGPVAGGQYSWTNFGDKDNKLHYTVKPSWGYHAGIGMSFSVRKRFFLSTSILYSTKGKTIEGKDDLLLKNKVVYKFIDVPFIYSVDFKAKIGNNTEFKYFLGLGPNISYWLGGKGTLYTTDFNESQSPTLNYRIAFKKDISEVSDNEMAVQNPNRLQLGLNLAAGLVLEPMPHQKFMFVLRYELGHSFFSTESNGYFKGTYYQDDLRSRSQGFRASLSYMIDLRPDQRKKGKSNVNKKKLH